MRGHVGFCRAAFGLCFIALTAGMTPCVSAINYFEFKTFIYFFFLEKTLKTAQQRDDSATVHVFRQIPRISIMLICMNVSNITSNSKMIL